MLLTIFCLNNIFSRKTERIHNIQLLQNVDLETSIQACVLGQFQIIFFR